MSIFFSSVVLFALSLLIVIHVCCESDGKYELLHVLLVLIIVIQFLFRVHPNCFMADLGPKEDLLKAMGYQ